MYVNDIIFSNNLKNVCRFTFTLNIRFKQPTKYIQPTLQYVTYFAVLSYLENITLIVFNIIFKYNIQISVCHHNWYCGGTCSSNLYRCCGLKCSHRCDSNSCGRRLKFYISLHVSHGIFKNTLKWIIHGQGLCYFPIHASTCAFGLLHKRTCIIT